MPHLKYSISSRMSWFWLSYIKTSSRTIQMPLLIIYDSYIFCNNKMDGWRLPRPLKWMWTLIKQFGQKLKSKRTVSYDSGRSFEPMWMIKGLNGHAWSAFLFKGSKLGSLFESELTDVQNGSKTVHFWLETFSRDFMPTI